jgi:hypothetical protein
MGTGFSSPGVKLPGSDVGHSTQFSTEVKSRLELYLYFLYMLSWREKFSVLYGRCSSPGSSVITYVVTRHRLDDQISFPGRGSMSEEL